MKISLQPYTLERCHAFWKRYEADPDMMDGSFTYNADWVDRYFHGKCQENNRVYFAVCADDTVIGEIQFKSIDMQNKSAVLSIHLNCNEYKNRGFGTQAEQLMITYGFEQLGLEKIYADCLHRNQRSRHILEKLGFCHLSSDDSFHYFILEK